VIQVLETPLLDENRQAIRDLVDKRRVLICVGSGGVGKTTTAATLGLLGAQRGKRTLVITIDW
jgi:Mrp family chromosome partitioning ATPase